MSRRERDELRRSEIGEPERQSSSHSGVDERNEEKKKKKRSER
jgi:hypothetical protein